MTLSPTPTGNCLLCRVPVYDLAALCPACERALEDDDIPVRPQDLDALVSSGNGKISHRAQRKARR